MKKTLISLVILLAFAILLVFTPGCQKQNEYCHVCTVTAWEYTDTLWVNTDSIIDSYIYWDLGPDNVYITENELDSTTTTCRIKTNWNNSEKQYNE